MLIVSRDINKNTNAGILTNSSKIFPCIKMSNKVGNSLR